ncbi:MAG: hypothetical protein G3M78_12655 [Candidatus Nitrohelix vancouverensis]|uniref:Uncharacterized protein n=1 Tax=Candidatus Nitrohelix vancouverensis TaxID=2705534 RepID=A0A7T0G4A5_9BACT|nr:MAG: hypothetical protein G3M78_12655 [Candidatus Nitrohelix vancouverensis]
MPRHWIYSGIKTQLKCDACGVFGKTGHINESGQAFLCEACYIEKFIPMDRLRPLPHVALAKTSSFWGALLNQCFDWAKRIRYGFQALSFQLRKLVGDWGHSVR